MNPYRDNYNSTVLITKYRILFGEGKTNFSSDNSNELVNPEGKVWKWKTYEDYFREIGGSPVGA